MDSWLGCGDEVCGGGGFFFLIFDSLISALEILILIKYYIQSV